MGTMTNTMQAERWRPIAGYEGAYEVSDFGRVRSMARYVGHGRGVSMRRVRARFLRSRPNPGGYLSVNLNYDATQKTCPVHRLVLEAFVGPCPRGNECRHLDGAAANNGLYNLAWGTPVENARDRDVHGTHIRGERHKNAKLSDEQVVGDIIPSIARGERYWSIAARVGVSVPTISEINTGDTWSHLTGRTRG